MAEHLKPHQFKKGQSGNPGGGTALPKEVLKAKKTNRITLEKTLNEYLMLTRDELKLRQDDPKASALELAVGAIVEKAIKDGDQIRLNFILDRLVGKVKEQVEVQLVKPMVIHKLDGTDVVLGMEVKELPEGKDDQQDS